MDVSSVVPEALRLPLAGAMRRAAYQAQQALLRYPVLASHVLLRSVASRIDGELAAAAGPPPPEAMAALRREYEALLEQDLANVEAGLYPASLLFQMPLARYAGTLPRFLLDLPSVLARVRRRDFRDLPQEDLRRYPAYYRRTFHWQTDGYLSRHSARLYDLSVEFLFLGCADVMRRQILPPLVRFARRRGSAPLRILDVGCGTGRALRQVATALPGQRYFGVDLSPHFVEQAREELEGVPEVTLVAENAEALPFRDGYFDAVTSVYLFHELPRRTRRTVMAELRRVVRPGGLLVVADSAQRCEAGDLAPFLDGFSREMHEPFYRDYTRDPLEDLVAGAGFETQPPRRAWLSKVVAGTARAA